MSCAIVPNLAQSLNCVDSGRVVVMEKAFIDEVMKMNLNIAVCLSLDEIAISERKIRPALNAAFMWKTIKRSMYFQNIRIVRLAMENTNASLPSNTILEDIRTIYYNFYEVQSSSWERMESLRALKSNPLSFKQSISLSPIKAGFFFVVDDINNSKIDDQKTIILFLF